MTIKHSLKAVLARLQCSFFKLYPLKHSQRGSVDHGKTPPLVAQLEQKHRETNYVQGGRRYRTGIPRPQTQAFMSRKGDASGKTVTGKVKGSVSGTMQDSIKEVKQKLSQLIIDRSQKKEEEQKRQEEQGKEKKELQEEEKAKEKKGLEEEEKAKEKKGFQEEDKAKEKKGFEEEEKKEENYQLQQEEEKQLQEKQVSEDDELCEGRMVEESEKSLRVLEMEKVEVRQQDLLKERTPRRGESSAEGTPMFRMVMACESDFGVDPADQKDSGDQEVVERESEDDGVKEQEILKKEEETGKGVSLNPESESKVVEEKVVVVKVEAAGEKRSIVVESAFEQKKGQSEDVTKGNKRVLRKEGGLFFGTDSSEVIKSGEKEMVRQPSPQQQQQPRSENKQKIYPFLIPVMFPRQAVMAKPKRNLSLVIREEVQSPRRQVVQTTKHQAVLNQVGMQQNPATISHNQNPPATILYKQNPPAIIIKKQNPPANITHKQTPSGSSSITRIPFITLLERVLAELKARKGTILEAKCVFLLRKCLALETQPLGGDRKQAAETALRAEYLRLLGNSDLLIQNDRRFEVLFDMLVFPESENSTNSSFFAMVGHYIRQLMSHLVLGMPSRLLGLVAALLEALEQRRKCGPGQVFVRDSNFDDDTFMRAQKALETN